MTEHASYGQFCPVAMAAEIFCSRWTALILREMFCGSTRFNDLRRGVPRMSPTLLSKRLKEMQEAGLIESGTSDRSGGTEYRLTPAGQDLKPIVMSLGFWGQKWVDSKLSLKNLDPSLLMWDMRRWLDPKPLPKQRSTISYHFTDAAKGRNQFWLVVHPSGEVDLCSTDPGFDVDLYVSSTLRAMTAVWMGVSTLQQETDKGELEVVGNAVIASSMQSWLGLSPFARQQAA
jgi:DNA-binding HxlR family transcriptional regulator